MAAFLAGLAPEDKGGIMAWLRQQGLLNDNGKQGKIVTQYDYRDASGKLLFQVVRYEPKDFRQRKPDGKGGWIWNLDGVTPVPYRLPEWKDQEAVFLAEGERDADVLWEWHIPATTNPMGAGKWRAEYNTHFKGKSVVILPDNDRIGEAHARDVARNLIDVAKTVKIIRLPGLAEKGDVSDWMAADGTPERLSEIVGATADLTAAEVKDWGAAGSSSKPGLQLVSLGALLAEPNESVRWLLETHLSTAGLSLLASKPKVGKSTWARGLALAVARGEPFMGRATQKGTVIYLALEEKRGELREHFRAMGAAEDDPVLIHAAHAPEGALLELRQLAEKHQPVLIIVDPLLKLTRVRDANDYAQMTAALEPLLILARETGAHVLVVHHAGKGERAEATDAILGSTALFGGVDTALVMKRSERYRTIQSVQRYGTDLPETVLEFDPERRTILLGAEKAEAEEQRIGDAILEYLGGVEEPKPETEIDEAVEGRRSLRKKALRRLVAADKVERTGKGGKGDPFKYALKSTSQDSGFSGSPYIPGTREPESQNRTHSIEDKGEMLVPDPTGTASENAESREPAFLPLEEPESLPAGLEFEEGIL